MMFLNHLHFVFVISCPALVASGTCSKDLAILSEVLKYTGNLLAEAIHVTRDRPGPKDCAQIMKEGSTKSGLYRIWPLIWQKDGNLQVYCDMDTEGGGWTVIQRRGQHGNPVDYFSKTWSQYKEGFGSLDKEFWLGNDMIFALTNQGKYSLWIDLEDRKGEKRFATFNEFWMENEDHLYKLHVAGYSGNTGDSLSSINNVAFSTRDKDNNKKSCTETYKSFYGQVVQNFSFLQTSKGGWWYRDCQLSNLNGLNLNGNHESYTNGINYYSWKGRNYFLKKVEMKIRPSNYAG